MTTAIPLPRFAADPAPTAAPTAQPAHYVRPLAEIDAELADTAVRARRLLDQLAGTQRALAIVETRRRRLLEARARGLAVAELEQLLESAG